MIGFDFVLLWHWASHWDWS